MATFKRTSFADLMKNSRKQNKNRQPKQYLYKDKLTKYQQILFRYAKSKGLFVSALLQLLVVNAPVLYNSVIWRNKNYRAGREYTAELLSEYKHRLFNFEKVEKNKFVAELQKIIVELVPNYYTAVYGMID